MELEAVQAQEKSAEFALECAQRAGIEVAYSQGVRSMKLHRARYVGLAKTRLEHTFVGGTNNLVRIGNWLIGVPFAKTRKSSFVKLTTQLVFG